MHNITSDSSNVTLCPSTPISFTCQSTTGELVWKLDDVSIVLTSIGQTGTLGNFTLLVTNITELLLLVESTAIGLVVDDVTLFCMNELSSSLSATIRSKFKDSCNSLLNMNIVL